MLAWVLSRRDTIARTLLIWTSIAAVALLVAGCVRVVVGRAVMAGPKLGQAIEWTPCRSSNPKAKLPAGAMCGKLAVPVDYDHLDGDVATLAMIRFPATGDKIGSLVINPGGPGESGIDAALGRRPDVAEAGPRTVRPGRLRPPRGGVVAAGGLVQLRRRQRPAAHRAERRLQPGRRGAHRGRDQGVRRPLRRQDGQEAFWPTSARSTSPGIWTPSARRWATTS